MPWIDVKLFDTRVTEESVPKMIEALTQALAETSGASPDHIHVLIQSTSACRPAAVSRNTRRARPPFGAFSPSIRPSCSRRRSSG